jgi:DNA polymerase-1
MAQKICLIDGSGYIFRAFYGLPPLTAPDGTPVNAVYGFTNMFLRLTSKIGCDYCLVLFDAKRKNFRNDIFADYKGTRKEIPVELVPQFPLIREAVAALNISFLEMDGYEADDLIATYTEQALNQGLQVVVVSGDKDLMQLIKDGVEFYDPMKDKFFTPEDVKEKFGVYPDKVVEVQALSGDSIDNVPGVAGIGPKTAAQLINEYGSLEELLAHVSEIKQEKRRQTLIDNAENARISLQLVTLKKDVPTTRPLTDFHCRAPQKDDLLAFIDKYGFATLRPRALKWLEERCHRVENMEPAVVQKHYVTIDSEAVLKQLAERICQEGRMIISSVADGANPVFNRLQGLAFAVSAGEAFYFPVSQEQENRDLFAPITTGFEVNKALFDRYLRPLFLSKSILKIGHQIKETMHFISAVYGETPFFPYDDVAVMSYCLDSSTHAHDLETLSQLFLQMPLVSLDSLLGSGKNKITFGQLDKSVATDYLASCADNVGRLWQVLKNRLVSEHRTAVYETFDRPLVQTLYQMESRGIMVNAAELKNLSVYFDGCIKALETEIFALAGEEFNIGSPKQIGDILFGKQGLKGKKTATGAWATGADILENLAEDGVELAAKILDWRELSKLKSTYTDSLFALLDKNSRVHTTYSQVVANTGRLASNNPNLQNIPIRREEGKKIRSCFIAPAGHKLISCDYSQVELRLLAEVADVKKLKEAFASGIDVHAATAAHVFGISPDKVDSGLRRQAKAINFGIVYGVSAFGLAKNIGVSTAEAKAYIDAYFAQMPEIKAYMEKTIAFAHQHGYVETPFGRRCSILGINDSNKKVVANAERAAINAPIQGGAADIIKLAMNKVEKLLAEQKTATRMLLQIHDELVLEAPDNEVEKAVELVRSTMENIITSSVFFKAEAGVGQNWTEAH